MKKIGVFTTFMIVFLFACSLEKHQSIPLHSHNDYLQEVPLSLAFSRHFKSIEVDVYMQGDSLYVAHDFDKIRKGSTLRQLYLDPLQKNISADKPIAYSASDPLFLLVDIKRDGEKVYPILENILSKYKTMISSYENGEILKKIITVIISGDRPIDKMQLRNKRFSFLDGRIPDLKKDYTEILVPLYSNDWEDYFHWDGKGEMPLEEMEKLTELVEQAKAKGAWLRFWNTPSASIVERNNIMQLLMQYDNVLIGTDNIDEAALFFNTKENIN